MRNQLESIHGVVMATWYSPSSSSSSVYETLLYKDGFMSCNCQGWCIQKKDKITGENLERCCKHTKIKINEANRILEKKSGIYITSQKMK